MTSQTVTVIVDGKPQQREIDHISYEQDMSRDHRWPEEFPVLYKGEKLVRTITGEMIIVRTGE